MKVGVYLTGPLPPWTSLFMESVRAAMPGVPIVQLADVESPALPQIDEVVRLASAPLAIHRARHFARTTGDWLFLDTDAIVRRNVSDVFTHPFDIAVTDRWWPKTATGIYRAGGQPEFIERFPYNAGVIFSRCAAFWVSVAQVLGAHPYLAKDWYGDQQVLCELAQSGRYRVRVLPGRIYNYPPESAEDRGHQDTAILHYKGSQRKPFMEPLVTP